MIIGNSRLFECRSGSRFFWNRFRCSWNSSLVWNYCIWNVFNRNVLTRLTRNRIYWFTRLTRFWVITWNVWNLPRSNFTRVNRVSWELWLWCIRNWLTIRTDRDNVAIWCVGYSNYSVRVVLSYSSSTSGSFCSSVALNNWSVDLTKCVLTS